MNKHFSVFLVKLVGTYAILYLILGFANGLTVVDVLVLSAILALPAYIIGDVFILPRANNAIATLTDFAFSCAVIFLFFYLFVPMAQPLLFSFLGAAALGLFEVFFHRHVEKNIFLPDARPNHHPSRYQTEIAEELNTEAIREKNRRR